MLEEATHDQAQTQDKVLVTPGENRLHGSAGRALHQGCENDCSNHGQQEGQSKGTWFGDSYDSVLHQPGRQDALTNPEKDTGKGEEDPARETAQAVIFKR